MRLQCYGDHGELNFAGWQAKSARPTARTGLAASGQQM